MVERDAAKRMFTKFFLFISVFCTLFYSSRVAYIYAQPVYFWTGFIVAVTTIAAALFFSVHRLAKKSEQGESPVYMLGVLYGLTVYINQLISLQHEVFISAQTFFDFGLIVAFGLVKIIWFALWVSACAGAAGFFVRWIIIKIKNRGGRSE